LQIVGFDYFLELFSKPKVIAQREPSVFCVISDKGRIEVERAYRKSHSLKREESVFWEQNRELFGLSVKFAPKHHDCINFRLGTNTAI